MSQGIAKDAVFVKSVPISKDEHTVVRGPNLVELVEKWNLVQQNKQQSQQGDEEEDCIRTSAVLQCVRSLSTIGFQATNVARAAQEILHMIHGRKRAWVMKARLESKSGYEDPSDGAPKEKAADFFYQVDPSLFDQKVRRAPQKNADSDDRHDLNCFGVPEHCTVYVGATSNLFLSPACRDSLFLIAKQRFMDALVVSGGAFEFDIQQALDPDSVKVCTFQQQPAPVETYGNIAVFRSQRYREFMVDAIPKILFQGAGRSRQDIEEDKDIEENQPQRAAANIVVLSPSQFWARVARLLPAEAAARSVLWQCVENHIAVFSPSLVDGSVLEFLKPYVREQQPTGRPRLIIDLVRDIGRINRSAVFAKRSGMIVLGGGVVKHHVCNANLMRNGADFSVFINSAQEFDGSDAGARPDEAVSWGKIAQGGSSVKVYSEISAVLPLLVAMSFGEVLALEALRK